MLIAVALTVALTLAVYGTALWLATPREDRFWTVACVVATLPMCAAAYYFVRLPLNGALVGLFGEGEALFWIRAWYAPLTEEPTKLWPLLIPAVRRRIDLQSAGRYGLALGLGFALGEIFVVAQIIATKSPDVAALPWTQLGGFIGERFMTGAVHSGMTALALYAWRRSGWLSLGLAAAALAHFAANFAISAGQRGWLGSQESSRALVSLWVAVCFLLALIWLGTLQFGRDVGRALYGRAFCPECGTVYDRSLVGLNFGFSRRYEPCPHCHKWHWTKRASKEPFA